MRDAELKHEEGAEMVEEKRARHEWKRNEPYKVALVVREARHADIIAITASDYAWDRPFDLHLFMGDTAESDLDRFMDDYGDEWLLVDFPWVVSNVDLIDHCTTY